MEMQIYGRTGFGSAHRAGNPGGEGKGEALHGGGGGDGIYGRSAHRAGDPRGDKDMGEAVHGGRGDDPDHTGMGLCGKEPDISADQLRGLCFADSIDIFRGAKSGSGAAVMGGSNVSASSALNSPVGSSMGGRFGICVHIFNEEEALNAKVVDLVFNTNRAPQHSKIQAAFKSYSCCDGLMTDSDMAASIVKNEPLGRTLLPPLRRMTPVQDVRHACPSAKDEVPTSPGKDEVPTSPGKDEVPTLAATDKLAKPPRRLRYQSGILAPSCATSGRKPRQLRLHLKTSDYKVPRSASLQLAPPSHARLGARLTTRQLGVDPVVWQGVFSIPKVALSKDGRVNSMNLDVVQIYGNISTVLMVKHVSVLFAKIKGRVDDVDDQSVKACVCAMRTEAYKLRREIASLGGTPLNEPRDYWLQKYFLAKF